MLLNTILPFNLDPDSEDFNLSNFTKRIKSDIQDTGNSYKIEMDLPGFKKEEVNIKLENGMLTVSATKEQKDDVEEKNYICRERTTSSVSRQFKVGTGVSQSDISASMENGVLQIEVVKREQPKEDSIIEIK